MDIVPVIDLSQGRVVRGVRGERARYQPVVSALVSSTEPCTVAERLCEHCATDTLYVADLDALQGGDVQTAVLAALLHARPARRLWLDAGFDNADAIERLRGALGTAAARITPVLASESLASLDALLRCRALCPDALLSLDRLGAQALDRAGLWQSPAHWPQRVIAMTLDRVGAQAGPDLATLAALGTRARPGTSLVGAGGIRGEADLARAAAAGAQAWLVASALHDGALAPRSPATAGMAFTHCGDGVPPGHTVSCARRDRDAHPAPSCRTSPSGLPTMRLACPL